ncbi:MAG: hypothetical protein HOG89_03385 [Candidatus Peribacter sp.]|nr:hypothetical protein [Candidatus Peribacter sp.]MBT4393164.1 hypothetical protein [Candidatus Peribacter sp.]MBT4600492.1 hypothetical protein [Candidatus Peribacter sp.]MBT5148532.1 hypothetical protein [Candidatus Peribacter sp.]MBT5638699.1 hypothetical protein [Candidatus Peribacter sp.]
MNNEIFLHVGYLKTGSTFLQKEVFPHIKDMHYVNYNSCPDAFCDIMYSDAYHFREAQTSKEITAACHPGKNIISHEAFIGGDASLDHFVNGKVIATRLSTVFPKAKVLFVVRNQYDLAISLYKQYVHLGGRKPLRNFLRYDDGSFETLTKRWLSGISIHQLDYKPAIGYYAECFGKENVLVLPFELLKKDNHAFVQKITNWMGTEDMQFDDRHQNKGYGSRQIATARFLNRFVRSAFNESPLIPNIRVPGIGKLDVSLVRNMLQSKLSFALLGNKKVHDEQLRKDLHAYFKESNTLLNNEHNLQLETLCPGTYF